MTQDTVRYDARTVTLHWVTAALLVLMWGGAHMIDWFPKGPLRVDARSVHIVVGAGLLLLVVYRIVWRWSRGARFNDAPNFANLAAKALHLTLYIIIIATLELGIFNAWVRGDDLFGLGHIPAFGSYDKAQRHELANNIVGWHRFCANLILILAAAHALAAIGHFVVLKDKVLQRMLTYLE